MTTAPQNRENQRIRQLRAAQKEDRKVKNRGPHDKPYRPIRDDLSANDAADGERNRTVTVRTR